MMIVTISLNYWRFFRYLNTVVSTRSVHIHQLYRWTGINIFIILMICFVC